MGHDHGAHGAQQNRRRLAAVLILSSIYLVVEVVGGFLAGSLALLADAGHLLTDVAGIAMALIAMKLAARPANSERTYGYHRLEILAALGNAMLLLGVSGYILVEAYGRFQDPPHVATGQMLAIAGGGLLLNLASVLILRAGSAENLNVKGAYFEVLSDLFSSAGVVVAAGVIRFTAWYWVDPLVSVAIALFILPRTWTLLNEAVGVLLEGTPPGIDLEEVRHAMEGVPGVKDVHDLHAWTITSGMHALSAHAELVAGASHGHVLDALRDCVRDRFEIGHVTLQLEGEGCQDPHAHA